MGKLYWVLKRNKNNKLILVQHSGKVGYSYTRIPLTDKEAQNTLNFSNWKQVSNIKFNEYEIDETCKNYKKLLDRFFEVVKEHSEELEKVPSKKFTTDVEGTSKLVRSRDRLTIKIARRKNKKNW